MKVEWYCLNHTHWNKLTLLNRYYYQYNIDWLPACTLPIHSLLHIGKGILYCGPIWLPWTFFMEHYCGSLQCALHFQSQPWSNLNQSLLHLIVLEQLSLCYDLVEELSWWDNQRRDDGPVRYEHTINGCKYCKQYPRHTKPHSWLDDNYVLHLPFKAITGVDPSLQSKIASYVAQILGKQDSEVKKWLPAPLFCAGKLGICGGVICSKSGLRLSLTDWWPRKEEIAISEYAYCTDMMIYLQFWPFT